MKMKTNHTLCEPLECHSGARTHACYIGGGHYANRRITHPIIWDTRTDGALRAVPKLKLGQGGGSVRLVLIVFSSMTSHRLIFS